MKRWLLIGTLLACGDKAQQQARAEAEPAVLPAVAAAKAAEEAEEAKAAIDEQVTNLLHEAHGLFKHRELDRSIALLEQAKTLQPNDDAVDRMLASMRELKRDLVAGKWLVRESKDPMDDTSTMNVSLVAADPRAADPSELYLRCKGKRLEMYLTGVRAHYNEPPARARFDSEEPRTLPISRSESGDAVFIHDKDRKFAKAISEHSGHLLIEVRTFDGRALLPFELEGAAVAVPKVIDACGGWSGPKKRECNKPWPEVCEWEK